MRADIINALRLKLHAEIEIHRTNINIMLENPTSIQEHQDLISAIELELRKMSEAKDMLGTLGTL
jgi:hypothetical protein